tara:strand:- start:39885 stop:40076 length:192 start_codon:yes stop_codon:yes gene_type:complete
MALQEYKAGMAQAVYDEYHHWANINVQYKPWLIAVRDNNRKPYVLIDRVKEGRRSNPTVFMGC